MSQQTVLISRPASRASAWTEAIERAGAEPLLMPAIELVAVADDEPSLASLAQWSTLDLAIFTSVPAVQFTLDRLEDPQGPRLIAVGPGTADALGDRGLVAHCPRAGASSEALLEDESLSSVRDRRVAILGAAGGRQLLQRTLEQRGATVSPIHVYQRKPAAARDETLERVAARWDQLLLTATSVAVLEQMTAQLRQAGFSPESRPLVVVSPRIAEAARSLGYARIIVIDGPDADALVAALDDSVRS